MLPPWGVDVGDVSLDVSEVVAAGPDVEDGAEEGKKDEDMKAVVASSGGVALASRSTSSDEVSCISSSYSGH